MPATTSPRMLANRGANGIDGTVSTAFGVAAASGGPAVLLIGDVALAHDIGGLLAARRLELAITIVLVNNDGGGIFHFLPVAGEQDVYEEHVATPHGLDFDFAHAARPVRLRVDQRVEARQRSRLIGGQRRRSRGSANARSSRCAPTDQSRPTVMELPTDTVSSREAVPWLGSLSLAAVLRSSPRPRLIAISPVRAISIRPNGRTSRSKASIFS